MVIFNSYVKLPEGTDHTGRIWAFVNLSPSSSVIHDRHGRFQYRIESEATSNWLDPHEAHDIIPIAGKKSQVLMAKVMVSPNQLVDQSFSPQRLPIFRFTQISRWLIIATDTMIFTDTPHCCSLGVGVHCYPTHPLVRMFGSYSYNARNYYIVPWNPISPYYWCSSPKLPRITRWCLQDKMKLCNL